MNNKFPQIHLIYNRYKKASTIKKAVVEIRVTYNYQQKCHHSFHSSAVSSPLGDGIPS